MEAAQPFSWCYIFHSDKALASRAEGKPEQEYFLPFKPSLLLNLSGISRAFLQ